MIKHILLLILLVSLNVFAGGDDTLVAPKISIEAIRLNEHIEIDGMLLENVWQNSKSISDFKQRDPIEGANPSEKTVVYVVYDETAIYIGVRMFDSFPDSIIQTLTRRDEYVSSDRFSLFLDPYNDKRSGFYFTINAAGSISDGVLYNDNWDDDSWDGVWEAKAVIDNIGWTAEMKIPFSQLKFNSIVDARWGINFKRDIARKNERDYLVYVPKSENGFVSKFAELYGLQNINPPGKLEILPYVTGRAEYLQHQPGDPFNDGSIYTPGFGVDFKTTLGSNLTLNATVNPDFGQVEIDPAVINLSDAETFFSEKRPFFIEGSSIFDFGTGGASNYWGFNWGGPDFFYSRRIGRPPQGRISSADYVDVPEGTHILGAAKLNGKINDSWNIGVLNALTQREYADISLNGLQSEAEIEPLTYYGIFRAQNEFDQGKQGLGFISTLTSRSFQDQNLKNDLNKNAFTGGVDGWTFLDESKAWVFTGWMGFSNVSGSKDRMTNLQRNSTHYFQRPDADYLGVDSLATSLTGYAGRFYLNKQKGNFFFNSAFGFITPKFEVNDVGFLFRSDVLNAHIGGGYSWTEPTELYRFAELGGAYFRNYDFGGNKTGEGLFNFGYIQLLNYYYANWNLAYYAPSINNRRTRGGPLTLNHEAYSANLSLGTDNRNKLILELNYGTYLSMDEDDYSTSISVTWRPLSNLSFSFEPGFDQSFTNTQWIGAFDDPTAASTFGKRYVFAELNQSTVSAGIRLNWTFTPQLSLQLYVQPLISSGDYSKFKELLIPKSYNYLVYGEGNSTFDVDDYIADADGNGPAAPINIGNPDFNFKSLRGNAVLRWEYLPGSVLYFVWTQTRTDFEKIGELNFNNSVTRLGSARPDNIFMVKFTYWFNM
jgi:hypothetical protein